MHLFIQMRRRDVDERPDKFSRLLVTRLITSQFVHLNANSVIVGIPIAVARFNSF